jgi:hypothetical protein
MSMPRRPTLHRFPHSKTHQFDLFQGPHDVEAPPLAPQWQALPAETREALTNLMVRLMLDHADGGCGRDREEVRYDV